MLTDRPTGNTIGESITNWSADASSLFIFLVDHGGDNNEGLLPPQSIVSRSRPLNGRMAGWDTGSAWNGIHGFWGLLQCRQYRR
jgi:hypothetical protein